MKPTKKTMHIVTVIPLIRSKFASELHYFTSATVPIGAIVGVPLRSKTIHAIVIAVRSAIDLKSEIKNAPYEIKKLNKIKAKEFFPTSYMKVCDKLADYYASNIGNIIDTLIANMILENVNKISAPRVIVDEVKNKTEVGGAVYAVQGDDEDRMGSWRSLIRQEFARKRSVVIYAPTIEETENIYKSLEKGIEDYIFTLNTKISKKDFLKIWREISNNTHPVVIIATGSFSILPRTDIKTVIIECENSRGWIVQRTPYLDMRKAIESLAIANRQNVYLSDRLLRSETLYRLGENQISEGSPFKWRSISTAEDRMIDMKNKESDNQTKKHFKIISEDLKSLIIRNKEDNTHLFIFVSRKGWATMTVCDDCQTIVSCKECGAPVVLHTTKTGTNFFMCHKCGSRRAIDEECINCGGWRLTPLGIGIERMEEEILKEFSDIDLFKIDSDTTKTDKQITETLERFKSKPGSVLIGTELALLHLNEKLEHTAVASLDNLFAVPDFRVSERIMYNLIKLRAVSTRTVLVQTRKAEEKIFDYGLKGNLGDFYRQTLDERKKFGFPPFSTLVKISIEGKKDRIANEMSSFIKSIEPLEVDIFPTYTSSTQGNSIIHGLIKFEPSQWPDRKTIAKLRSLPPHFTVKIDPESLL